MTDTQPKKAPRLTVKQLHDNVKKQFDELYKANEKRDELVATLDHDLALNKQKAEENRHLITGEPMQRKLQGISRAHAEIAALKKRFDRLESMVGENADPARVHLAARELETINARITDLFGEAMMQVGDLQQTVDEHTELLDGHESRINAAAMEAGMATEGVHSLSNRVTVFEEAAKFPLGRFVIAAILGLIAGFIWSGHTFAQTKKLADGSKLVITSAADSWWAPIVFGLLVFAFFFFVLTLFRRKAKTETTKETTTITEKIRRKPLFGYRVVRSTPVPPVRQPVTPIKETTDTSTTPTTKVLETSAGASGARS